MRLATKKCIRYTCPLAVAAWPTAPTAPSCALLTAFCMGKPVPQWLVGGWAYPSEKYESQWGWDYPIYEMENKIHVWNHQPLMVLEPSINPRLFRCEQKGWFWPIPMGIITRLPFGPRCMQCQTQGSFSQGPFQDPKMEVPTVYKAYIRPKFQGISLQNKALYGTVPPF